MKFSNMNKNYALNSDAIRSRKFHLFDFEVLTNFLSKSGVI